MQCYATSHPASRVRFIPLLLVLLFLFGVPLTSLFGVPTYRNPIAESNAGADPAVLYHDGRYYTYTTNGRGAVFISDDLIHWEEGPRVVPEELEGVWAPEVYYHPEDGKFYMYYTDRYKIGVAVADRPDELFENLGYLAIPGIDGHPFRDDDGQLYLYFTHTPSFTMYCIPMRSPAECGGPVTKCFEISQAWERHSHEINEGPWMMKLNGTYYLFYCGSNGQTVYYSIGYATAPTPLGPFTKNPDNPVIAHTEKIWGPGHGSFTMDRSGQWWHLYHQKTSQEIDFETGEMYSLPTKGEEQPGPNLDPSLTWCPEISPRGSYFFAEETITLYSRTPGAKIHYTLDGSEPTTESSFYEKPVVLDRTAVLKARAFKKGMTPSTVAQMRFTRTMFKLDEPERTYYPSGNPPFRVWPTPVLRKPPKDPPMGN